MSDVVDLDALLPRPVRVRLKGKEYDVLPQDGLPLEAVLEAQKFQKSGGMDDAAAVRSFLAKATGIPVEAFEGIAAGQFSALMSVIFPKVDANPQSGQAQA